VGAAIVVIYWLGWEGHSYEAEGPWIELVHCKILHERKLNTRIGFVPPRIEPLAQACRMLAVKPVVKSSSPARDHFPSLDSLRSAQLIRTLHITHTSAQDAGKPLPSSDPCGHALSCNVLYSAMRCYHNQLVRAPQYNNACYSWPTGLVTHRCEKRSNLTHTVASCDSSTMSSSLHSQGKTRSVFTLRVQTRGGRDPSADRHHA
jgi:hypothetical protein